MPPIWTTPTTWNVGQLVNASDMNTNVRDNIEWLKTPPHIVLSTPSTTTSSLTFVQTGLLNQALGTNGGRMWLMFHGSCVNTTSGAVTAFDFTVDGTPAMGGSFGLTTFYHTASSGIGCLAQFITPALPPGLHTFTVTWRVSGGLTTLSTVNQFSVREI
jgi:hypothetical protein